jgi:putative membrane protein
MKTITIALIGGVCGVASPALAQQTDANSDVSKPAQQPIQRIIEQPPAVSGEETGAIPASKLSPGANSFTEGQARSRIESAGFTDIGPLKQDAQGIWRGMAYRGVTRVAVGLDFRGNVAAEVTKAQ